MKKKFFVLLAAAVLAAPLAAGCGPAGADEGSSAAMSSSGTEEEVAEESTAVYAGDEEGEYIGEIFAMDTYMTLTAYGENAEEAVEAGIEEIERLDDLLSTGTESSEVAQINASGGGEMSEDTAYLAERALEIWESTGGAFDITIYPVMDLWGFTTGDFAVPDEEELAQTLALVGAGSLEITEDEDGTAVLSMAEGQEIDFGGIAKGYASSRVMEIFEEYGVESAIISLGGNVHVLGAKIDGSEWRVGIQDPDDEDGYLGALAVTDTAVITSGGYERYFEDEETGEIYHHIIDPSTGYSADSGLISVTIVSADSTLADGLSTALFVMGTEEAVAYCEEHCTEYGFDAFLETEDGDFYITDNLEDAFIDLNGDTELNIIETE